MILNTFKKMITGGQWTVAYSTDGGKHFSTVTMPKKNWCADPFIYEANGEQFVFVEQYVKSKEKGCIGYFHFEKGVPVNKGICIENQYHMSYPCVFDYEGHIYMIPESSANNSVDLYIAECFPEKWKKVKSLITDKKYVDSTVYIDNGHYYLISYIKMKSYEVHVFELDMITKTLRPISRKRYEKNVGRPAGRIIVKNDGVYRPAQDCSKKYGEDIIFYKIDCLNHNGELLEHEVGRLLKNELRINEGIDRVHHITSTNSVIVIDVFKETIDLLHVPRILLRKNRK